MIGWNVSLSIEGPAQVIGATLGDDVVALEGFGEPSAEVDSGGAGAVSAVALNFLENTLDSTGNPYEILTVTLMPTGPGICHIAFADGLQGSGAPSRNVVVDQHVAAELVPQMTGATVTLQGRTESADCNGNKIPDAVD